MTEAQIRNVISYLRKIANNNEAANYDIYHYEIPRTAADIIESQQRTIARLSAPVTLDELNRALTASIADEWGGVNTHPIDCLIKERLDHD